VVLEAAPAEPTIRSAHIDESSRRWTDEVSGEAIPLPDGQTWVFHLPEAVAGEDLAWSWGDVPADLNTVLNAKLRASVRKYLSAGNDDDRTSGGLEIAWRLALRNYRLSHDEFEQILLRAVEWDEERQRSLTASLRTLITFVIGRAVLLRKAVVNGNA
jgi:hypothetical protein